uniref:Uncharacterized protein n=1 Tax=Avena sativa TaxID=4498 RepID=A0ACD5YHP3_AVESA
MALAEEIPADLARAILYKLGCPVDRRSFAAVCRPWRQAAAVPAPVPVFRKLPLILLPTTAAPTFSCVIYASSPHPLPVPTDALNARFFGSQEGGWVFVALARGHTLLHLPTDLIIPIPDTFTLGRNTEHAMVIHGAVLSSAPGDEECIGAAVVSREASPRRYVTFWVVGGSSPASCTFACTKIEDMLFQKGVLLVLTKDERLLVCIIQRRPDGSLADVDLQTGATQQQDKFYDGAVLSRYLVSSAAGPGLPTSSFRLFRPVEGIWTEVFDLDGRVLFVSRCCSRSYESIDLQVVDEGVFFLDDISFNDPDSLTQRQWQMESCSPGQRLLFCTQSRVWYLFLPNMGTALSTESRVCVALQTPEFANLMKTC